MFCKACFSSTNLFVNACQFAQGHSAFFALPACILILNSAILLIQEFATNKEFSLIADPADPCSLFVCLSVRSCVTTPYLLILSKSTSCSFSPCLAMICPTDGADALQIIHFLSRLHRVNKCVMNTDERCDHRFGNTYRQPTNFLKPLPLTKQQAGGPSCEVIEMA